MGAEGRGSFSLHLILAFLLFSYLNTKPSSARNSISQGQSLLSSQFIVSKNGEFELGFFTPGNSHNYYIGIWYKKIPIKTIIWVANRNSPISNISSAELRISKEGSLVLLDNSKTPVWSASSNSRASIAVLLDTGNLVLRNGLNSSANLWESFAYPTDTWMPGGWLGMNKITGEYLSFTAWKNSEDPAAGLFSERMNPNGLNEYVLIWNGSEIYWSSGLWTGRFFPATAGTAEKTSGFNVTFVDNKERKFSTYTITDSSLITRYVLHSDGHGRQWYWLNTSQQWQPMGTIPLSQCGVYSLCGPFGVCNEQGSIFCSCLDGFKPVSDKEWGLNDWSSGCHRKTRLSCGSNSSVRGEKDGLLELPNMRLPANPENLVGGSAEDCRLACFNNCSCVAYAYESGCSTWTGGLRNLQQLNDGDSGGGTLFLRLAASDIPSSGSSSKKVISATVGMTTGVVILFAVVVLVWARRRRRQTELLNRMKGSLIRFTFSELQWMTNNFSEKLGTGGFGSVFKGTMPDSTTIAVKQLQGLMQGEKQFRNEVSTLGAIQHVNLVHLRGFCFEDDKRLLVYEYMPGGSLDTYLFREGSVVVLDWMTRYQIMLGTARGLAYLHEKCRECIIHCDIKPDNILLDSEFCAKVADFGMAKLLERDFSRVLTTMRGTVGYLAPEWISGLPVTPKVDVYSFGMMLFELVSGRRNAVISENGSINFYPSQAAKGVIEGQALSLFDQKLVGVADEELTRVIRLAIWCVQDTEDQRPSMGQVVQILEGSLEVSTPPMPTILENVMQDFVAADWAGCADSGGSFGSEYASNSETLKNLM